MGRARSCRRSAQRSVWLVGILFGFAALAALPETFITTVSVPIPSLIILLVFAVLAGLVAAIFPARRAGRLDVLAAIATE